MATPKFNSKSPTIKRILREASELSHSPSPDFAASPASDTDLFDWHFTLRGPPSSAFANGIYHGRIVLPPTYPLRPPSFRFLTPSGRFEVNREICLSISGHHEETWMPAWGVRTALTALRAFMETDVKGQVGGMECNKTERERFANDSVNWKCSTCQRTNKEILDESVEAAATTGKKVKEEAVPEELKMVFKNELRKGERELQADKDDAELAEGFVHTHPNPNSAEPSTESDSTRESGRSSVLSSLYPPARPAQTVPQPTAASGRSNQGGMTTTEAPARQQPFLNNQDGVPLWIDRAIAAIVICLVAMVLKVLLA